MAMLRHLPRCAIVAGVSYSLTTVPGDNLISSAVRRGQVALKDP